jgi:flagellar hook assembly protein FlgD
LNILASGGLDNRKVYNELGQEDFLRLLITQLTTQDPTNPVQNEDFVAQMAQFSTLTGIEELNEFVRDFVTDAACRVNPGSRDPRRSRAY